MIVVSNTSPLTNLVMDERRGRVVAERFGLRVLCVLGVSLDAKQRGLIPAVKPLLDALKHSGFWVAQGLYSRVLQAAGE